MALSAGIFSLGTNGFGGEDEGSEVWLVSLFEAGASVVFASLCPNGFSPAGALASCAGVAPGAPTRIRQMQR